MYYRFYADFAAILNRVEMPISQLADRMGVTISRVHVYVVNAYKDPDSVPRYDRVRLGLMLDALGVKPFFPLRIDDKPDDQTRWLINAKLKPFKAEGQTLIEGKSSSKTALTKWVAEKTGKDKKFVQIIDTDAISCWLSGIPYRCFSVDWDALITDNDELTIKHNRSNHAAIPYILSKFPGANPDTSPITFESVRYHLGLRESTRGRQPTYDRVVLGSMLHALGLTVYPPFYLISTESNEAIGEYKPDDRYYRSRQRS
jgi:hypothetical protein